MLTATWAAAAAALLSACGGHAGGAMPAANAAGDARKHNQTFSYTGYSQSFRVPAGVTKIKVVARGGRGAGSHAAHGGRLYAVIPVTPGERLVVYVGGAAFRSNGGFNGGADGGQGYYCTCRGYGGGGASDVRQGGDGLGDRVLVVGGGGGKGGSWSLYDGPGGHGGKGGGRAGASGHSGGGSSSGSDETCAGRGGGGGTQSAGGSGGAGGYCYYESYSGNPGAGGTLGAGGAGGQGAPSYGKGPGGGGGGGGYYGGGGGGAGSSFYYSSPYGMGGGGGGGGGSSYVEPSVTRFRGWQGWKTASGNGQVVFSW